MQIPFSCRTIHKKYRSGGDDGPGPAPVALLHRGGRRAPFQPRRHAPAHFAAATQLRHPPAGRQCGCAPVGPHQPPRRADRCRPGAVPRGVDLAAPGRRGAYAGATGGRGAARPAAHRLCGVHAVSRPARAAQRHAGRAA
ncbi:hypothetical protein G6F31_020394 [Rhizopus arrhizus]|nr:hypothetical protein G6F31_020394 [Rhizopus arrhizus]